MTKTQVDVVPLRAGNHIELKIKTQVDTFLLANTHKPELVRDRVREDHAHAIASMVLTKPGITSENTDGEVITHMYVMTGGELLAMLQEMMLTGELPKELK